MSAALAASALFAPATADTTAAAQPAATSAWSQPAVLSTCPSAGAPLVAFPSDSPTHSTGPGAIVWSATRAGCPEGAGARVAALGDGDVPGPAALPRTTAGRVHLHEPLALAAGPDGHIVLASSASTPGAAGLLSEGSPRGSFSTPTPIAGPPAAVAGPPTALAFATAYLGDVALAAPLAARGGVGVQLRVQRHRARAFAPPIQVAAGAGGRVQELGVGLDYRSDALVLWRRSGSLYARDLPASGRTHAPQRLAPTAGPPTRIAVLLSDDNRGIVAWWERRGGQTSVYVDRSSTGVRFGAPQLLERFADAGDPAPPEGSPRLIRLSSESVMLAWTGLQEGRWAVRTAAIDLNGVGAPNTISVAGHDAVLAGLAPGPDGEALALWTEPQRTPQGLPDLARQAIFAARGIDARPARTIFGKPELVAPAGPNSHATVALDPDSDRALAVWQGEGARIDYAIRALADDAVGATP
jgi:hypothetical protein